MNELSTLKQILSKFGLRRAIFEVLFIFLLVKVLKEVGSARIAHLSDARIYFYQIRLEHLKECVSDIRHEVFTLPMNLWISHIILIDFLVFKQLFD